AFIVPDVNSQIVELRPSWTGATFNNKFDLFVNGDQLGANYADKIALDGTFNRNVTLNLPIHRRVKRAASSVCRVLTINGPSAQAKIRARVGSIPTDAVTGPCVFPIGGATSSERAAGLRFVRPGALPEAV